MDDLLLFTFFMICYCLPFFMICYCYLFYDLLLFIFFMISYCLPFPGFAHQSCLRSLLSTWSSKNYNEDHPITLNLWTQTFPKLVSLSRSLKNCQSGYLKSTPLPQDTCNGAVHILRQPKWGVRSRAVAALRRQCEKKAEKARRRLKGAKAPPFFQEPF